MNEIEYAIEQLERRADAVSSIGEFEEYNALTTALAVLRAELARQDAKPLTWNEHINQMTVEEKADVAVIMSKRCSDALSKESCPDLTCWQCFIEFLNSQVEVEA